MDYRIGEGSDTHQLVEGTPLIIGGVSIPFHKGSKGHSDGDVLFHAIVDALEKEKSNNTVKGDLIKSSFITSTMGVSYKLKLGKSI